MELSIIIREKILEVFQEVNPTPSEGAEAMMSAAMNILYSMGVVMSVDPKEFTESLLLQTIKQLPDVSSMEEESCEE